jgi:hypothetical protein
MPRTTIVAVQELDNGDLLLIDAAGGQHQAKSAAAVWVLLKQILANPDLPEVENPSAEEIQLEDVATAFVESQMPHGLGRLARPAVTGILEGLRNLSRKNPSR